MKVKCWICGNELEDDGTGKRQYCKPCGKVYKMQYDSDRAIYDKIKAKIMIDRAIGIMEKQGINVYEYKEEIEHAESIFMEDYLKFRSAEEIVACVMLIANEIKIKMNYKIGTHIVDIFIPSLCCIVEIDGYMHETEKKKLSDGGRDNLFRIILGNEWETIRIPTKYLHKNAEQLLSAVLELKASRVKTRQSYGGYLPDGYSRTQDMIYRKLLK